MKVTGKNALPEAYSLVTTKLKADGDDLGKYGSQNKVVDKRRDYRGSVGVLRKRDICREKHTRTWETLKCSSKFDEVGVVKYKLAKPKAFRESD